MAVRRHNPRRVRSFPLHFLQLRCGQDRGFAAMEASRTKPLAIVLEESRKNIRDSNEWRCLKGMMRKTLPPSTKGRV